ncbi:MAG: hypothetical protein FJ026_14660 [Chloroflexi bacterium]|nr:hypothetical protein [Chloroflexota bacterium]
MTLRMLNDRTARRLSRWRGALVTVTGITCGALLLGLFGSAAGAVWSLALGYGAGVGAVYGGSIVLVLGLVLVPVNARMRRELSLGLMALALLTLGMLLGVAVWCVRAAM